MSCLGNNYLPIPPREWSRVENVCVYETSGIDTTEPVYFAPLKKFIPSVDIAEAYQMIYKGNVLQYKANSSNLTKQQRYSKIARDEWTNRTKTWSTQGQAYSQPNTNYLKRVGEVNIYVDPTTNTSTNATQEIQIDNTNIYADVGGQITCPHSPFPFYADALPSRKINPYLAEPTIPSRNISGSNNPFPAIIPVAPTNIPIVIPDGGKLLYNVQEDPCTGETVVKPAGDNCYSTTASDVPGPETFICYRTSLPTYYPKTRLTMSNSTNKWPTNAKLIRSLNDANDTRDIINQKSPTFDLFTPFNMSITNPYGKSILNFIR